MATRISTRSGWAIAAAVVLGMCISMVVTFVTVRALFPDDWFAAEAEIEATRVVSSREGTLSWTLLADVSYRVDGTRYEKSGFKILHEIERVDTLARQGDWPVGKRFTLYVRANDLKSIALEEDGGREALAVMLAVLAPGTLIAIASAVYLVRRSRESR